jgi:hypothetical protein
VNKGDVDPVQWGAGKFDAYAGLKEVITRAAGVANIEADPSSRLLVKDLGGNVFNVFVGGESLNINVYNMSGNLVRSQRAEGSDADIDLSSLAGGVYLLSVNNRFSQRILVK